MATPTLPNSGPRRSSYTPRWRRRLYLLIGLVAFVWFARKLTGWGQKKEPQIIYASRYSDEFKYRPAASPVITEHLPDGRIRLRGANPGGVGIRPGDLPKTPKEIQREKEKAEKKALEDAKRQLGIKDRSKDGTLKNKQRGKQPLSKGSRRPPG